MGDQHFGYRTTLLALLLMATASVAQEDDLNSGLPLFADRETLDITIEGPLTTLVRERSNEDYYDGMLRYQDSDGNTQSLDLKFRTRGNFRRRPSTCQFPPVRLNLRKKQAEGTLFEGQNILKLVTHCRPGSSRYEQFVLKEELAYRILNLHTPLSFRSRLLRITWINTDDDNEVEVHFGFLIEHKNELQARTGMQEFTEPRASYGDLTTRQSAIIAMYQYFIGNTDFSMVAAPEGEPCCHNGVLLRDASNELNYIAYDFDIAGIVNAPYAEPHPSFKLRRVTDRLYRGHCRFNPEMEDVAALYLQNQAAVMRMIDEQEAMDAGQRQSTRAFLERFYNDISTPRLLKKNLLDDCVGRAR